MVILNEQKSCKTHKDTARNHCLAEELAVVNLKHCLKNNLSNFVPVR